MGSLKLLQDLHNKNQSSQTRLRFVVSLLLFLARFSPLNWQMNFLHMVWCVYETYGS